MEQIIIALFHNGGGTISCSSPADAVRQRHRFYRERKRLIPLNPDYENLSASISGSNIVVKLTPPLVVTFNSGETFSNPTFTDNLAEEIGIMLEEKK
jgi:hypothetical protein